MERISMDVGAMGLSSSQCPLLDEEQQPEGESANLHTEQALSKPLAANGTILNTGPFGESMQIKPLWRKRRLEDYGGLSGDDTASWSLFEPSAETSASSQPQTDDVVYSAAQAGTGPFNDGNEREEPHAVATHTEHPLAAQSDDSSRITIQNSAGNNTEASCASIEDDYSRYERGDRGIGDATVSQSNSTAQFPLTRNVDNMTSSEPDEVLQALITFLDAHEIETVVAWSLELLALLISVSCLTAIVVLLARYDNQPQPSFTEKISFNALIAIFSTIMRATVLFIVCEVIGELKWDWIEDPRRLREIEYFINASMGALGSLKFLTFSWRPIMTVAGSFVVIASSGIGPFSQQAAASYSCSRPVKGTAEILVAHNMSDRITSEMRGAAVNGLMYGSVSNSLTTSSLFRCPAESCNFEDFNGITHTSIGMCSSCVAGSNFSEDTSYVLGMRTIFDSMPKLEDLAKEAGPKFTMGSLRGKNMTISLDAFTRNKAYEGLHAYVKGLLIVHKLSVDCTIYPCLRTYNGQVVNGSLHENVVSQTPLTPDGYSDNFVAMIEPCSLYGFSYSLSNISQVPKSTSQDWTSWMLKGELVKLPPECLGVISSDTYGSIQDFIDKTIVGSCNVSSLSDYIQRIETSQQNDGGVDCGDKWWLNSLLEGGDASLLTVFGAFDGMAEAMTNIMRTTGLGSNGEVNDRIIGSSSQPAICVKTYWAWLLYPETLLVVTAVLLVSTFRQSFSGERRRPIWKSSVLPLVFYDVKTKWNFADGQNVEISTEVPLLKLEELKAVADHTVVRFDIHADAPGFVTEEGERGLSKVLFELEQGGISGISELPDKEYVPSSKHAKAPGIVDGMRRLRKRRMTAEGVVD